MKAFLAVHFENYRLIAKELAAITEILYNLEIEWMLFTGSHDEEGGNEDEMMQRIMEEIDGSDFLLAETSCQMMGIGVEAGYAKARNKPVIYVRNRRADHAAAVSGISDYRVTYEDVTDLQQKLFDVIATLCENKLVNSRKAV